MPRISRRANTTTANRQISEKSYNDEATSGPFGGSSGALRSGVTGTSQLTSFLSTSSGGDEKAALMDNLLNAVYVHRFREIGTTKRAMPGRNLHDNAAAGTFDTLPELHENSYDESSPQKRDAGPESATWQNKVIHGVINAELPLDHSSTMSRKRPYIIVPKESTPMQLASMMLLQTSEGGLGLSPPNAVISVTGGAMDFFKPKVRKDESSQTEKSKQPDANTLLLNNKTQPFYEEEDIIWDEDESKLERLKDAFKRGIMRTARDMGGWVVDGGFDAGVMKIVGEAAKSLDPSDEGHASSFTPFIRLGIVTSSKTRGVQNLMAHANGINEKDFHEHHEKANLTEHQEKNGHALLNKNRSHYILVGGLEDDWGTEIQVRYALEEYFDRQGIPSVLVIAEGGPGTLDTAQRAALGRIPLIVFSRTGRVASAITKGYSLLQSSRATGSAESHEAFEDFMKLDAKCVISGLSRADMLKRELSTEKKKNDQKLTNGEIQKRNNQKQVKQLARILKHGDIYLFDVEREKPQQLVKLVEKLLNRNSVVRRQELVNKADIIYKSAFSASGIRNGELQFHTGQLVGESEGREKSIVDHIEYRDKEKKWAEFQKLIRNAVFSSVHEDAHGEALLALTIAKWQLQRPSVVCSVTGGAIPLDVWLGKSDSKSYKDRADFLKKLVSLFSENVFIPLGSCYGWAIDGGNRGGVMELLGHANAAVEGRVPCIGIASLSDSVPASCELKIRQHLEDKMTDSGTIGIQSKSDEEGKECIQYNCGSGDGEWKTWKPAKDSSGVAKAIKLDSRHTNFLLVQPRGGEQSRGFGTELAVRGRLEQTLESGIGAKVVSVVVSGGPNTVRTAVESSRGNAVIASLAESGRAASAIAWMADFEHLTVKLGRRAHASIQQVLDPGRENSIAKFIKKQDRRIQTALKQCALESAQAVAPKSKSKKVGDDEMYDMQWALNWSARFEQETKIKGHDKQIKSRPTSHGSKPVVNSSCDTLSSLVAVLIDSRWVSLNYGTPIPDVESIPSLDPMKDKLKSVEQSEELNQLLDFSFRTNQGSEKFELIPNVEDLTVVYPQDDLQLDDFKNDIVLNLVRLFPASVPQCQVAPPALLASILQSASYQHMKRTYEVASAVVRLLAFHVASFSLIPRQYIKYKCKGAIRRSKCVSWTDNAEVQSLNPETKPNHAEKASASSTREHSDNANQIVHTSTELADSQGSEMQSPDQDSVLQQSQERAEKPSAESTNRISTPSSSTGNASSESKPSVSSNSENTKHTGKTQDTKQDKKGACFAMMMHNDIPELVDEGSVVVLGRSLRCMPFNDAESEFSFPGFKAELLEQIIRLSALQASPPPDDRATDLFGETSLIRAARLGLRSRLVECISAGNALSARIHKGPARGMTALMLSAQNGHVDCVRILLAAGADVNQLTAEVGGRDALMMALQYGHTECAEMLSRAGAEAHNDPEMGNANSLHIALLQAKALGLLATQGDTTEVESELFSSLSDRLQRICVLLVHNGGLISRNSSMNTLKGSIMSLSPKSRERAVSRALGPKQLSIGASARDLSAHCTTPTGNADKDLLDDRNKAEQTVESAEYSRAFEISDPVTSKHPLREAAAAGYGDILLMKNVQDYLQTIWSRKVKSGYIQELVLYIIFLTSLTFVCVMGSSGLVENFYPSFVMGQGIQDSVGGEVFQNQDIILPISFNDVASTGEYFAFIKEIIFGVVLGDGGAVSGSQVLISPVAFRQLRASTKACKSSRIFKQENHECPLPFSKGSQLTDPFGPNNEFVFSEDSGAAFLGIDERQYTSGGFNVWFALNESVYLRVDQSGKLQDVHNSSVTRDSYLTYLEENFVDQKTRMLSISFFTWSPSASAFVSAEFWIELSAIGATKPGSRVYSMHVIDLSRHLDRFVVSLACIIAIMSILALYEEIKQILHVFQDMKQARLHSGSSFHSSESDQFHHLRVKLACGCGNVKLNIDNGQKQRWIDSLESVQNIKQPNELSAETVLDQVFDWVECPLCMQSTAMQAADALNAVDIKTESDNPVKIIIVGLTSYFSNLWNVLDIVVPSLSLTFVLWRMNWEYSIYASTSPSRFGSFSPNIPHSFNLINASRELEFINALGAIIIMLAWMKLLRYSRVFRFMGLFLRIIWAMVKELRGWGILFSVFLLAFSFAHLVIFGAFLPEYRGVRDSLVTILRASLGDIDYGGMNEFNRALAPVLYLITTLAMGIILLNTLIAQMADSYTRVSFRAKKEYACDRTLMLLHSASEYGKTNRKMRKNKSMLATLTKRVMKQVSHNTVHPETEKAVRRRPGSLKTMGSMSKRYSEFAGTASRSDPNLTFDRDASNIGLPSSRMTLNYSVLRRHLFRHLFGRTPDVIKAAGNSCPLNDMHQTNEAGSVKWAPTLEDLDWHAHDDTLFGPVEKDVILAQTSGNSQ